MTPARSLDIRDGVLIPVKGLAPVFFGLVFYRRLAGCRQAENSPKFGNGFGA
jgi:hypothetical protein